ncbi:MAG: hypothetical protein PHR53_03340 [Bacteroidales bacterium]|nr:hypothetical protein [Bacteroidales bacterium]
MKKQNQLLSLLGLVILLLTSCQSTQLTNIWSEKVETPKVYQKFAVICMLKDPSMRNIMEEEITAAFNRNGLTAIKGNMIIPESKDVTKEMVQVAMQNAKIEAVVVLRPMGVEKNVYVDTYYSYGWYGYWGGYYPTSVSTSKNYKISNEVYDQKDQLIWSAQSNSCDPTSVQEVAQSIATEMLLSLQSCGWVKLSKNDQNQ